MTTLVLLLLIFLSYNSEYGSDKAINQRPFFPFFFFFFLLTKNGLDIKQTGYSTFVLSSSSSQCCINPPFIACIDVNILCFANLCFILYIYVSPYSLWLARLFSSKTLEKVLLLLAATVLTLLLSKQERPPSVFNLSFDNSPLTYFLPSLIAQLTLVCEKLWSKVVSAALLGLIRID